MLVSHGASQIVIQRIKQELMRKGKFLCWMTLKGPMFLSDVITPR